LCSERFCDLAPAQVYATLLDEGVYRCSIRQMYRILHEADLVHERRAGHGRKNHTKPVVSATGPNQCWTWDISRLAGPTIRTWFYLYVVMDIFFRAIVAWSVDNVESDKVARRMIKAACKRQNIDPNSLTLHSDRGAQMTSNTMAELLEELG
jgi:putative transposase